MTTAIPEVRSFPAKYVHQALRKVESAGCRALYAPEFGQARAKDPNNPELQRVHDTLTGIYTGSTKRGARFVAFAQTEHHLANSDNIHTAIKYGLSNGAAAGQEIAMEAARLLALEGQGVFVIPHERWRKIKSGPYTPNQALEPPLLDFTTAFLGGLQKAEEYVEDYHSKVVGDEIRIWKADDPDGTARLAVFSDFFSLSLYANGALNFSGRFAGVQRAEGAQSRVLEARV